MFWNKKKVVEEPIETRSFASKVSGNIENEAVGNHCRRTIITILQSGKFVAGIYGRAFAQSADVEPVGLQPALTPGSFRGNRKIIHHCPGNLSLKSSSTER